MLEKNDLSAIRSIIEDLLERHMTKCPLSQGFTEDELRQHAVQHREGQKIAETMAWFRRVVILLIILFITNWIPTANKIFAMIFTK